jgi:UPF0271 protein
MTARRVLLNADLGEDASALHTTQPELVALIDLANVACGGHAGDDVTMRATVQQCLARGVQIGAHPSYPDRAGFGRTRIAMERAALLSSLRDQIDALLRIAAEEGGRVLHVKPHGALYHDVSDDPVLARAFAALCTSLVPAGAIVLRAGCVGVAALQSDGVRVWREAFADRGTDASGRLLARGTPGALLTDPTGAAQRARGLVGACDTVCLHADTPNAVAIAAAVRAALAP